MNFADVIAIQVTLNGINQVLSGLDSLARRLRATNQALADSARAGALWIAVGAAIALGAMKAAAAFGRLEMSTKAMFGAQNGARFARQLQNLALNDSPYSLGTMSKAASGIAYKQGPDKTLEIMRAMSDLAAMGGSGAQDFERIAMAISQISGKGKVMAEELRQQIMEAQGGQVIAAEIAKALKLKNAQSLVGVSDQKFFEGLIKAGQARRGFGAQAFSIDPFLAVSKMFERLAIAMQPTGRILNMIAAPILMFINQLIDLFRVMNELTGGAIGLILIIATLTRGVILLMPWVMVVINAYRAQAVAMNWSLLSITNLRVLLAFLNRRIFMVIGSLWSLITSGAALRGAQWLATAGFVGLITATGNLIAAFAGLLLELLPIAIIGMLIVGVLWLLYKLIAWIVSLFTGGDDKKPSGSSGGGSDSRPYSRSSWENTYYRRYGNAMGG